MSELRVRAVAPGLQQQLAAQVDAVESADFEQGLERGGTQIRARELVDPVRTGERFGGLPYTGIPRSGDHQHRIAAGPAQLREDAIVMVRALRARGLGRTEELVAGLADIGMPRLLVDDLVVGISDLEARACEHEVLHDPEAAEIADVDDVR